MNSRNVSSILYVASVAAVLIFVSSAAALAQSCAQRCRTDPVYKIMNQQACLRAALTGSCSGARPTPPVNGGPPIESHRRPTQKSLEYYRSLGLPGDIAERPPSERKRIIENRAFSLLDKQKTLLQRMDGIANTPPQSASHARSLREDFNEAKREYDRNSKQLRELKYTYERGY